MNRRLAVATLAALALALTAGCLGLGTGVSEDALAENETYDWDVDANATIDLREGGLLSGGEFAAVYRIDGQSELQLYRRGITRNHALDVRAIKFRYPDGTVVGHEEIEVEQSRQRTTVVLPADEGHLAFTADRRAQELSLPAFVEGSHEVILPPEHRVGDFLLSDVVPRGYETEVVDDRQRVRWESVDDRVLVRYYFSRDWYVFYGLVAVLSVVGAAGYLYFMREIRRIVRWRREQGLDVDEDDLDDDQRRPPPGMR